MLVKKTAFLLAMAKKRKHCILRRIHTPLSPVMHPPPPNTHIFNPSSPPSPCCHASLNENADCFLFTHKSYRLWVCFALPQPTHSASWNTVTRLLPVPLNPSTGMKPGGGEEEEERTGRRRRGEAQRAREWNGEQEKRQARARSKRGRRSDISLLTFDTNNTVPEDWQRERERRGIDGKWLRK